MQNNNNINENIEYTKESIEIDRRGMNMKICMLFFNNKIEDVNLL